MCEKIKSTFSLWGEEGRGVVKLFIYEAENLCVVDSVREGKERGRKGGGVFPWLQK